MKFNINKDSIITGIIISCRLTIRRSIRKRRGKRKVVGHGYIFDRRIENSTIISSCDKSSHHDLKDIFFLPFQFTKETVLRVEISQRSNTLTNIVESFSNFPRALLHLTKTMFPTFARERAPLFHDRISRLSRRETG